MTVKKQFQHIKIYILKLSVQLAPIWLYIKQMSLKFGRPSTPGKVLCLNVATNSILSSCKSTTWSYEKKIDCGGDQLTLNFCSVKSNKLPNTDNNTSTMNANQVFTNILQGIENSNLDYFMSKTPFSATISLKSSFVKKFKEAVKIEEKEFFESLSRKCVKQEENDMKEIIAENLLLKAQVKNLEVSIESNMKEILDLKQAY